MPQTTIISSPTKNSNNKKPRAKTIKRIRVPHFSKLTPEEIEANNKFFNIKTKNGQSIQLGSDDAIVEKIFNENMIDLIENNDIEGDHFFIATEQSFNGDITPRALLTATKMIDAINKFETSHGRYIWIPGKEPNELQIGVPRLVRADGVLIKLHKIRKENIDTNILRKN